VREETLSAEQLSDPALVDQLKLQGWEIDGNKAVLQEFKQQNVKRAIISEDLRPTIPKDTPGFFKDIIRQCWTKRPQSRPKPDEVVEILAKELGISAADRRKSQNGGLSRVIQTKKTNTQLLSRCAVLTPTSRVSSCVFLERTEQLWLGCDDGRVYIMDTKHGSTKTTLSGHKCPVTKLKSAGATIWSADESGTLILWDGYNHHMKNTYCIHEAAITDFFFTTDPQGKRHLWSSDTQGVLIITKLLDKSSHERVNCLKFRKSIAAMVIQEKNLWVASHKDIFVYDCESLREASSFRPFPSGPVTSIISVGQYIWVGGATIKIYDAMAKLVRTLDGHGGPVSYMHKVVVNGGRVTVWTGSEDSTILVWDAGNYECLQLLNKHNDKITCIDNGGSASRVASVSWKDLAVSIWEYNQAVVNTLRKPSTEVVHDNKLREFTPPSSKVSSISRIQAKGKEIRETIVTGISKTKQSAPKSPTSPTPETRMAFTEEDPLRASKEEMRNELKSVLLASNNSASNSWHASPNGRKHSRNIFPKRDEEESSGSKQGFTKNYFSRKNNNFAQRKRHTTDSDEAPSSPYANHIAKQLRREDKQTNFKINSTRRRPPLQTKASFKLEIPKDNANWMEAAADGAKQGFSSRASWTRSTSAVPQNGFVGMSLSRVDSGRNLVKAKSSSGNGLSTPPVPMRTRKSFSQPSNRSDYLVINKGTGPTNLSTSPPKRLPPSPTMPPRNIPLRPPATPPKSPGSRRMRQASVGAAPRTLPQTPPSSSPKWFQRRTPKKGSPRNIKIGGKSPFSSPRRDIRKSPKSPKPKVMFQNPNSPKVTFQKHSPKVSFTKRPFAPKKRPNGKRSPQTHRKLPKIGGKRSIVRPKVGSKRPLPNPKKGGRQKQLRASRSLPRTPKKFY